MLLAYFLTDKSCIIDWTVKSQLKAVFLVTKNIVVSWLKNEFSSAALSPSLEEPFTQLCDMLLSAVELWITRRCNSGCWGEADPGPPSCSLCVQYILSGGNMAVLVEHHLIFRLIFIYFLQELFVSHSSQHPIVILKDINFKDLCTVIHFMYYGEVNIQHDQLNSILKVSLLISSCFHNFIVYFIFCYWVLHTK